MQHMKFLSLGKYDSKSAIKKLTPRLTWGEVRYRDKER